MTDRGTLSDFIRDAGITMSCARTDSNPDMDPDGTRMDHWRCTLRASKPTRSMSLTFSMGFGHHGKKPETADILNCIALDASSIENAGSFDGWCSVYGYDTDSRKAERVYRACDRQAKRLRRFLGTDALYQRLLFHTESL